MNIKDIRTRKGLTQAEVASALGVSSVVYSRYETGSRQPSIDILIQLADIFGVTVDYLLGRQDIEDSTKNVLFITVISFEFLNLGESQKFGDHGYSAI